jgi:hypothetical protein
LSSLVENWENSQKVETKKFSSIIKIKEIDFLSIDCEGKDLDIIKNIDFDEYSIKIICCEKSHFNEQYNKNIIEHLIVKGYNLVVTTNHNFIFVKNDIHI